MEFVQKALYGTLGFVIGVIKWLQGCVPGIENLNVSSIQLSKTIEVAYYGFIGAVFAVLGREFIMWLYKLITGKKLNHR